MQMTKIFRLIYSEAVNCFFNVKIQFTGKEILMRTA